MPARNSIKTYLPNSFYHVYNRGVEKHPIFLDDQDFAVFLSYLKDYLSPKNTLNLQIIMNSPTSTYKEKDKAAKLLKLNNFYGKVDLIAYALMPNHFHFLIKQAEAKNMDQFLNSLATRYTMYFNKKHHRVGTLYQGVYKAVLVETEAQLLHLSRYIHLNPPKKSKFPNSLPDYLEFRHTTWLNPQPVLTYFNQSNTAASYFDFMNMSSDLLPIANQLIDIID